MKKIILVLSIITIVIGIIIQTNWPNQTKQNTTDYDLNYEKKGEKIQVETNIQNKSELMLHKKKQEESIKNIELKNKEMLNNTEPTITFVRPISIEELEDMTKKYNFQLISCEVKFLNGNEWVTGFYQKINSEIINYQLEMLKRKFEKNNVVYCGITSVKVNVNLSYELYKKINQEESILLADFSELLIRDTLDDKKKVLKISVDDLAWYAEELTEID